MGLPEVVDVARNFAVMVRVQGLDPKGLKMRNHAFHQYNSGKTTLSASGMLLPGSSSAAPEPKKIDGSSVTQPFVVVTVASVVEPFLSLQHREKYMSQDKPDLIPGVQIDIMVEGKKGMEHDIEGSDQRVPHWLSAQLLALVDVPLSSAAAQSLIQASSGSSDCWEVGWSLASFSDGPQPLMDAAHAERPRDMEGGESSNPNFMGRATAKIAILGVPPIIFKDLPNLNISPSIKRGDLLLAMGSPFGVLSPVHFFNSISVGSVANCYPCCSAKRTLLMADIRCLPGMEGGPVFGEHALLIGILTRPLRQKNSGAEIQLVIPWEAIATACSDLLQEEPQNAYKEINCNSGKLNAVGRFCLSNRVFVNGSSNHIQEHDNSACPLPSPIEKAMASVCLVTIDDGVWASGVLLNKEGLILTNAHLLEPWRFRKSTGNGERNETKSEVFLTPSDDSLPSGHEGIGGDQRSQGLLPTRLKAAASVDDGGGYRFDWTAMHRTIRVRLNHKDPWIWCDARVVYVSKGPLDIALLQLEFVPDQLCPIVMDFTNLSVGSKVYVIGHGLFGPRCDLSPSACVGAVAKVVDARRPLLRNRTSQQDNAFGHFPAMLETTAAVHPGGSGGAIVNSDGHMIGLVTSNARHGGGTTIPHLNFSIPCAALEPIFKFSKGIQDFSLLDDLDKPNEHLSSVWALMPPLSSKPGPSLPNLPHPLPVDINKDGKGSRFAKFMAESQDLFGKSSQLGKMERLSTVFSPSKL